MPQHVTNRYLNAPTQSGKATSVPESARLQGRFADFPSVFLVGTGRLAVTSALLLLALGACAKTPAPFTSTSASTTSSTSAPTAEPAATPQAQEAPALQTPAYTASNIALAFNYIDANKNGQLSREEAAGFRGVAKNFDAADTDKDGSLSRQEFDNAMNRSKPK